MLKRPELSHSSGKLFFNAKKKKNIIYLNLAASLASPMHGEQAKHAHCIHGYGNPRTLTRTRDCHLHKHEPSHSFRPHHHQLHTVLLLWCYHTLPPWYTPPPNDTHPRGTHLQYLFSRGTTSQTAHVAVLCIAHHRRITAAKDSKGQRNNLPIMCSMTQRANLKQRPRRLTVVAMDNIQRWYPKRKHRWQL